MKLSEKIVELRKIYGITQETLAEICKVSRQSISKWEADMALPELEKILILSDTFHVSADVLLRDEYEINSVKNIHTCGPNAVSGQRETLFEGILIKESLVDDSVIDLLAVNKIELWNTGGTPKYWTALFFTSGHPDLPKRLSEVMVSGPGENWFVDFKAGMSKYVVFRDKILKYTIGNLAEKEAVCAECRKMGISDDEMNWPE